MFKKVLLFFLGIYIVFSLMYFGYKIFPILENYFTEKNKEEKIEQVPKVHPKISLGNCDIFSFGHIAGDEFRIFTRIDKDKELTEIDESNLQKSIYDNTCDRAGTLALIFFDSQPVSVASIRNYDYSKPFAQKTENKPIVYSVLKETNNIAKYPESGFVVALYGFDRENIGKYQTKISTITKMDEDLVNGHNDTIFLENTKKEARKVESEYETIKTDLDNNGEDDLIVLSSWTDKALPKGVSYVTIYILSNINGSDLAKYEILPFTKIRKSGFYLFQIVDLDNDGRKEVIIRKSREGNDSFLVYKFDKSSNSYINTNKTIGTTTEEEK